MRLRQSDALHIGRLRRDPIRAAFAFGAVAPWGVVAGGGACAAPMLTTGPHMDIRSYSSKVGRQKVKMRLSATGAAAES